MAALCAPGTAATASTQPEKREEAAEATQILVMLRLPEQHYRPNADYGGGYGDDVYRNARRRIAARIAREHGLRLVDNWPMPLLGVDCFVMAVPDGRSSEEAAAAVSRDSAVAWSQPLHLYHSLAASAPARDPLFPVQPAAQQWQLANLHKMATGKGVVVAVIDSKVEAGHPDLRGQVAVSKDFVSGKAAAGEQHGTGVAGVIAAVDNNGMGIAGIAPDARLMALRACWQGARTKGTVCDSLSLAKALHYAIEKKVPVINMSLSGPPDTLLAKLLQIGASRGITIVAAFDRNLPRGGFPASQPGVIAVSDASLPAPHPGVYTAPGKDVPTTRPGGRWHLVDGSSYSAAHVSGLVALLRERGARKGPLPSFVATRAGGGLIDACATLIRAAQPCDCSCPGVRWTKRQR